MIPLFADAVAVGLLLGIPLLCFAVPMAVALVDQGRELGALEERNRVARYLVERETYAASVEDARVLRQARVAIADGQHLEDAPGGGS